MAIVMQAALGTDIRITKRYGSSKKNHFKMQSKGSSKMLLTLKQRFNPIQNGSSTNDVVPLGKQEICDDISIL